MLVFVLPSGQNALLQGLHYWSLRILFVASRGFCGYASLRCVLEKSYKLTGGLTGAVTGGSTGGSTGGMTGTDDSHEKKEIHSRVGLCPDHGTGVTVPPKLSRRLLHLLLHLLLELLLDLLHVLMR
jgi:hypothetical protein